MDIIGKVVYLHVSIQIFAMRQHRQYVCQQPQNSGVLELLCVHINRRLWRDSILHPPYWFKLRSVPDNSICKPHIVIDYETCSFFLRSL